jgi:hypothetical protein
MMGTLSEVLFWVANAAWVALMLWWFAYETLAGRVRLPPELR